MTQQAQPYSKAQYGPQASAFATEASSYAELGVVQTTDLVSNNNFIQDRGLGDGVNVRKTLYGIFDGSGTVTYNPIDFVFLKHWIGNLTGAGTAGDPYILTEATSVAASAAGAGIIQPFSYEIANTSEASASADFAVGCVGSDFTLSGAIGEKLSCTANFPCRHTGYRNTAETYTPLTTSPLLMINGTWKYGASPTTLSNVRAFTVTYANGLITDTRSLESRFPSIFFIGARAYSYSVQIGMSTALATTIYNDFYGLVAGGVYNPETGSVSVSPTTSLEVQLQFVNGSFNAWIQLDEAVINDISKPVSIGGGISVLTFNGMCQKGLGNVPFKWWTV